MLNADELDRFTFEYEGWKMSFLLVKFHQTSSNTERYLEKLKKKNQQIK